MKVENGLFLPQDQEAMLDLGLVICTLTGKCHADLKMAGMKFKISDELEAELLKDILQNRSHITQVAFLPELFLPASNNEPLAMQDSFAKEYLKDMKGRLRLQAVDGGISRTADYEEIISQFLGKGTRLAERGFYLYPRARTRTRAYPQTVGPQNYVVDIGPLDFDGLNVQTLGRDDGDPEVGLWILFWPKQGSSPPAKHQYFTWRDI